MSQPPGPSEPPDPWEPPGSTGQPQEQSDEQPTYGQQPAYGQPAFGQPAYGQPAYGQPAYGQPAYGAPGGYPPYAYQSPTNGKATAALWTGVGALVLTFCCGLGVLGIVPLVLGIKARSEISRTGGQQGGSGMALAGIITGAVAVVLSLAFITLIVVGLVASGGDFIVDTGTRV